MHDTRWILRPPPSASRHDNGKALTKLFCIPQAGVGAWVYNTLAKELCACAEVLPIELPGRNSRAKEPAETHMHVLARQICDVVEAVLKESGPEQQRYALFGHSMGAWLCYETAQEIKRRDLPMPLHVYVAANRAPHLCGAQHDLDQTRLSKLETPDEFFAALTNRYGVNKHLESPTAQRLCYPTLKADFTLVESYQHDDGKCTPLECPLTAIGAREDNRYTEEQLEAWGAHAADLQAYRVVWLNDVSHNFIATPPSQLVEMLTQDLSCS